MNVKLMALVCSKPCRSVLARAYAYKRPLRDEVPPAPRRAPFSLISTLSAIEHKIAKPVFPSSAFTAHQVA